jgi:hypothetical protein
MPSPTPAPPASAFDRTEPMPLPEADLPEDSRFASTEPMQLASTPARREPTFEELSLAPIEVSLYEVIALIRKDNRICPQPSRWLEFFRLLQENAHGRRLPAAPLSGSAWASTSALAKRMCLREQVEWAAAHGWLQPAYDYLKALPDSDWYFAG